VAECLGKASFSQADVAQAAGACGNDRLPVNIVKIRQTLERLFVGLPRSSQGQAEKPASPFERFQANAVCNRAALSQFLCISARMK
jgi:hypothetical protein